MSTMNNCRLGEFEDVGLAFRKGNILTSHEDRAQGRGSSATHHSPGHCRRLGGFEWRLCGVWSARCGLPQNFHLFGAPCWNVGHGSFCHSFDRMIRCWLDFHDTFGQKKGALSESLCTACKNGEAAAGRHQHQVMPVLIGVRWM